MTEAILLREFQRLFAALDDYAVTNEASGARVREFITAHLRSTAPFLFSAPPSLEPIPNVERTLADGAKYRLAIDAGCVLLTLSRPDAALSAVEAIRLRADIEAVAGSVTR